MRYLVIILVAANVAFFFLYPSPPVITAETRPDPHGVPGSEQLVLLSERPAVTVSEVEILSSVETGNTELVSRIPADLEADDTVVVDTEAPVDPVIYQDSQDFEQVTFVNEIGESRKPESESVEIDNVAVAHDGDTDERAVDEVVIGGESGNAGDVGEPFFEDLQSAAVEEEAESGDLTATVEQVIVQEVALEVTPDPVCYAVGPFLLDKEASAVAKQLVDGGYGVSERGDTIREPRDYWVYLSAMPKDEARRVVADLKARGIKDYFVGKQNYISLGIFSRKSQALRRQKQIAGLGYDAVLDRRFRDRSVRWLDVRDEENTLGSSQLWSGIQEKYQDAASKPASCD